MYFRLIIITAFLVWCFSPTTTVLAADEITLAYVPGKNSSFYRRVEKGIRLEAQKTGAKVIVPQYPESWDGEEQKERLLAVFSRARPQVIVISPAASQVLQQTLYDLYSQGIEIISIDRTLESRTVAKHPIRRFPLIHISTDQVEGGKAMAVHMAQLIEGKGKVYINSTFPDIVEISKRFKSFLKTMEAFPNITIIGIDIAGIDFSNSDRGIGGSSQELERNAYKQSLEIIQKHPDINGIFCTNDLSGKGIIKAIKRTGLEGSIKIGVWDTTEPIFQAIDNGVVNVALAQNPEQIGITAVYWAHKYLTTGEITPASRTIDFQLITKINSSEKSSRHLVY